MAFTATTSGGAFAELAVTHADMDLTVGTVTDELARIEGFDTASGLRAAILHHYPGVSDE